MTLPEGPFPAGRLLSAPATDPPSETWTVALEACDEPVDRATATIEPADANDRRLIQCDDDTASIAYADTTLDVDRRTRTATLRHSGALDRERLVHPYLAAVGICAAHWRQTVPLHAGAVLIDGRAWGILARREHGKSTTLAALADAGFTILTDDLLVIDRHLSAHVGPRCLDLRGGGIAEQRDDLIAVESSPGRDRLRLQLGDAPSQAPMGGFVYLGWHDTVGAATVPVPSRGAVIGSCFAIDGPPAAPALTFELSTLPMALLHRPQRLDALPATLDALVAFAQRHTP